jgi:hypothetical protein
MGDARLPEPLNEALRDECPQGLRCITSVVKVMQVDREKTSLMCNTSWVWTPENVSILFVNGAAVGAPMVYERVVSMDFMSSGKPAVYILNQLLILYECLFLECVEEYLPRDETPGGRSQLEFLFDDVQKGVSVYALCRKWLSEELMCWPSM